jgi:hypothetical protein
MSGLAAKPWLYSTTGNGPSSLAGAPGVMAPPPSSVGGAGPPGGPDAPSAAG